MDFNEGMGKCIVIEKCKQCPFHRKSSWFSNDGRRWCHHPNIRGAKEINYKGKKFPEWCPLSDYALERCDKIQLKRKKMMDHIKQRKKCKK